MYSERRGANRAVSVCGEGHPFNFLKSGGQPMNGLNDWLLV